MWSGACFANECEAEPPRRRRFVQLDSGAADDRHARSPVPCRSQGRQADRARSAHHDPKTATPSARRICLVGGSVVRPA